MTRQSSDTMTKSDVAVAKRLLLLGFQQKRIAALFDVNQGRISEINSGAKWGEIPPLGSGASEQITYPLKKKGEDR